MTKQEVKKRIVEPVIFIAVFVLLFGSVGHVMGFVNMLNTLIILPIIF